MIFLLVVCWPDPGAAGGGECHALNSYATQQECRAAAVEAQRGTRIGHEFFVACARAPGAGK